MKGLMRVERGRMECCVEKSGDMGKENSRRGEVGLPIEDEDTQQVVAKSARYV